LAVYFLPVLQRRHDEKGHGGNRGPPQLSRSQNQGLCLTPDRKNETEDYRDRGVPQKEESFGEIHLMTKAGATPKKRRKSIRVAESKLEVLPPEKAQALFTVAMMEEAVSVLHANLRATKRMWSQAAGDFVEIPDGPTQVESAKIMLAYGIGQPVQRVISVTTPEDDLAKDFDQKLKQSPALRESLQDMVKKAAAAPDAEH
jgi:hypothetical protein